MKKSKKIIGILLAFVMLFGAVSSVMAASAADNKKHLQFNENLTKAHMDEFVGILDGLVGGLAGGLIPDVKLDAFAQGAYYTNRNAAELGRTIYKFLATIQFSGIGLSFSPLDAIKGGSDSDLAVKNQSLLDAYNAAEKLGKEQGVKMTTMAAWDLFDFSNVDFGFKDGERAGFLDALMETIGYVGNAIYVFEVMSQGQQPILKGEQGMYNTMVVSLLQTLGVSDYPAWKDYGPKLIGEDPSNPIGDYQSTPKVKTAKYLMPILTPVLNELEKIAAAPLSGLLAKLPNLMYSFEQGRLDGVINMVLGMEGMGDLTATLKTLGIIKADGTINHDIVGALNGLINGFLGTLVPGVEFGLPVLDINWDDVIAKHGAKDGAAGAGQTGAQKVINAVDSSDMLLYLYNYVADALDMEGNQRLIKAYLILSGADESTTNLVMGVIGMDRQDLLVTAMSLLGVEDLPEIKDPTGPVDPTDPADPSTPDTENPTKPEIPQTGDAAIAAFGLLAIAGAAGLYLTKKKKA